MASFDKSKLDFAGSQNHTSRFIKSVCLLKFLRHGSPAHLSPKVTNPSPSQPEGQGTEAPRGATAPRVLLLASEPLVVRERGLMDIDGYQWRVCAIEINTNMAIKGYIYNI